MVCRCSAVSDSLFENFDWTQIKAALDVAKAVLPGQSGGHSGDDEIASSSVNDESHQTAGTSKPVDQRVEVSGDNNNVTIMFSSPVDAGRDVSFNRTNVPASHPSCVAQLNQVISIASTLDPNTDQEELELATAKSILLLELLVDKMRTEDIDT